MLLPARKGALFERGRSGADGHNAGVPPHPSSLYWAGMPRALSAGWELTGWHPLLPRLGGYTPTALFPGWCWLSTDGQPASQAPVSSNIHSKVPVTLQSPWGRGGADRLKLVASSYNVCPALGPSPHSPSWKLNPPPHHWKKQHDLGSASREQKQLRPGVEEMEAEQFPQGNQRGAS